MIGPQANTTAKTRRHVSCRVRDRIILAFLLAVNESNNAALELETATSDKERARALETKENATDYSHHLRIRVLHHCLDHGC
ncbi:MAG TPA: hypothetical protein VMH81_24670 [Bryobacteraceae bacterium]|nr:hypothetical protein [Bryobacteraceae bacterium]